MKSTPSPRPSPATKHRELPEGKRAMILGAINSSGLAPTNGSGTMDDMAGTEYLWFQSVYLGYLWAALVIGLPGNVLIAVVYLTVQQKRTSDWFIFFLSVYDCAVCVFAVPLYLSIETGSWMATGSDLVCKMEQFIISTAQVSSVFILGIIAVDRYLKICLPTKKSLNATQARNIGICTPLFSALVAAPALVWDGNVEHKFCRLQDHYKNTLGVKIHKCLIFGFFVCMFFLVIFCYLQVSIVVKRRVRRHRENAMKRKHLMQIPAFLQAISNVDDTAGNSSDKAQRGKRKFSLFSLGSSRRLSAISPWIKARLSLPSDNAAGTRGPARAELELESKESLAESKKKLDKVLQRKSKSMEMDCKEKIDLLPLSFESLRPFHSKYHLLTQRDEFHSLIPRFDSTKASYVQTKTYVLNHNIRSLLGSGKSRSLSDQLELTCLSRDKCRDEHQKLTDTKDEPSVPHTTTKVQECDSFSTIPTIIRTEEDTISTNESKDIETLPNNPFLKTCVCQEYTDLHHSQCMTFTLKNRKHLPEESRIHGKHPEKLKNPSVNVKNLGLKNSENAFVKSKSKLNESFISARDKCACLMRSRRALSDVTKRSVSSARDSDARRKSETLVTCKHNHLRCAKCPSTSGSRVTSFKSLTQLQNSHEALIAPCVSDSHGALKTKSDYDLLNLFNKIPEEPDVESLRHEAVKNVDSISIAANSRIDSVISTRNISPRNAFKFCSCCLESRNNQPNSKRYLAKAISKDRPPDVHRCTNALSNLDPACNIQSKTNYVKADSGNEFTDKDESGKASLLGEAMIGHTYVEIGDRTNRKSETRPKISRSLKKDPPKIRNVEVKADSYEGGDEMECLLSQPRRLLNTLGVIESNDPPTGARLSSNQATCKYGLQGEDASYATRVSNAFRRNGRKLFHQRAFDDSIVETLSNETQRGSRNESEISNYDGHCERISPENGEPIDQSKLNLVLISDDVSDSVINRGGCTGFSSTNTSKVWEKPIQTDVSESTLHRQTNYICKPNIPLSQGRIFPSHVMCKRHWKTLCSHYGTPQMATPEKGGRMEAERKLSDPSGQLCQCFIESGNEFIDGLEKSTSREIDDVSLRPRLSDPCVSTELGVSDRFVGSAAGKEKSSAPSLLRLLRAKRHRSCAMSPADDTSSQCLTDLTVEPAQRDALYSTYTLGHVPESSTGKITLVKHQLVGSGESKHNINNGKWGFQGDVYLPNFTENNQSNQQTSNCDNCFRSMNPKNFQSKNKRNDEQDEKMESAFNLQKKRTQPGCLDCEELDTVKPEKIEAPAESDHVPSNAVGAVVSLADSGEALLQIINSRVGGGTGLGSAVNRLRAEPLVVPRTTDVISDSLRASHSKACIETGDGRSSLLDPPDGPRCESLVNRYLASVGPAMLFFPACHETRPPPPATSLGPDVISSPHWPPEATAPRRLNHAHTLPKTTPKSCESDVSAKPRTSQEITSQWNCFQDYCESKSTGITYENQVTEENNHPLESINVCPKRRSVDCQCNDNFKLNEHRLHFSNDCFSKTACNVQPWQHRCIPQTLQFTTEVHVADTDSCDLCLLARMYDSCAHSSLGQCWGVLLRLSLVNFIDRISALTGGCTSLHCKRQRRTCNPCFPINGFDFSYDQSLEIAFKISSVFDPGILSTQPESAFPSLFSQLNLDSRSWSGNPFRSLLPMTLLVSPMSSSTIERPNLVLSEFAISESNSDLIATYLSFDDRHCLWEFPDVIHQRETVFISSYPFSDPFLNTSLSQRIVMSCSYNAIDYLQWIERHTSNGSFPTALDTLKTKEEVNMTSLSHALFFPSMQTGHHHTFRIQPVHTSFLKSFSLSDGYELSGDRDDQLRDVNNSQTRRDIKSESLNGGRKIVHDVSHQQNVETFSDYLHLEGGGSRRTSVQNADFRTMDFVHENNELVLRATVINYICLGCMQMYSSINHKGSLALIQSQCECECSCHSKVRCQRIGESSRDNAIVIGNQEHGPAGTLLHRNETSERPFYGNINLDAKSISSPSDAISGDIPVYLNLACPRHLREKGCIVLEHRRSDPTPDGIVDSLNNHQLELGAVQKGAGSHEKSAISLTSIEPASELSLGETDKGPNSAEINSHVTTFTSPLKSLDVVRKEKSMGSQTDCQTLRPQHSDQVLLNMSQENPPRCETESKAFSNFAPPQAIDNDSQATRKPEMGHPPSIRAVCMDERIEKTRREHEGRKKDVFTKCGRESESPVCFVTQTLMDGAFSTLIPLASQITSTYASDVGGLNTPSGCGALRSNGAVSHVRRKSSTPSVLPLSFPQSTTCAIHSTLLGCLPTHVAAQGAKGELGAGNKTYEFFVRSVFDAFFDSSGMFSTSEPCLTAAAGEEEEVYEFPLFPLSCGNIHSGGSRNDRFFENHPEQSQTLLRSGSRSPNRSCSRGSGMSHSWYSLNDLEPEPRPPTLRKSRFMYLAAIRRQLNDVFSPRSLRQFFGISGDGGPSVKKSGTHKTATPRDRLSTNHINVIITRCESLVLEKHSDEELPPMRVRASTLDPACMDKGAVKTSAESLYNHGPRVEPVVTPKPRASSLDTTHSSISPDDQSRSPDTSIDRSRGCSLDLLSPASASLRTGSMCSGMSSISRLTECSAYTETSRSDCEKITRRTAEREHNITRMLGVITFIFVISWSVSWAVILHSTLSAEPVSDSSHVTLSLPRDLFLVNHFCNIIVYVMLSKSFRDKLAQCYKSVKLC